MNHHQPSEPLTPRPPNRGTHDRPSARTAENRTPAPLCLGPAQALTQRSAPGPHEVQDSRITALARTDVGEPNRPPGDEATPLTNGVREHAGARPGRFAATGRGACATLSS